jgi:hypothetical protein
MYYSYPVQYCCCLAMPLVLILVNFYQMFFLPLSYTRIILFFLIHDMIHDTEGLFFLYVFVNNALSAENHLWRRVMLGTLLNSVAVSCLASALVHILINFYQMFFLPLSYTRINLFFFQYTIFLWYRRLIISVCLCEYCSECRKPSMMKSNARDTSKFSY